MELEASGLQIGYGDHVIVNQMDVSIARNKITTIIGPNGSGKSTLLKALTRLIRYQKGSVILDGCDIQTMKPKSLAKKLGVLPQIHTAPSDFRVKELVGYGRMPHQKLMSGKSKEDEEVIRWAMEVTGTWKFRDKSIYEISGGETQRVWIATVLAQKPEIMFLDEPTTGLDPVTTGYIHNMIKKLAEKGTTIILTTHNMDEAAKLCDNVGMLYEGKIVEYGNPQELCYRYRVENLFRVISNDDEEIYIENNESGRKKAAEMLVHNEIKSIHTVETTLQTIFVKLTGKELENESSSY